MLEVIVEAISLTGFPQTCSKHFSGGMRTATYAVTIAVDGKEFLTCDFPQKETKKEKTYTTNASLEKKFGCAIANGSTITITVVCKHRSVHDPHTISTAEFQNAGNLKFNEENPITLTYYMKKIWMSGTLILKVTRVSTTAEYTQFKLQRAPAKCLYTVADLEGLGVVSQILKSEIGLACPEWVNLLGSIGSLLKVAEPVAEIDPNAKIALSTAEFAFELFMKQKARDERVIGLVQVMTSVYQMLLDSDPLHKCRTLHQSVNDLIALTRECSYFISKYTKIGPFAHRMVVNAISNADDLISQFEKQFSTLKEVFFTGAILSIGQMNIRMLEKLDRIDGELTKLVTRLQLPVLGRNWSKFDGCVERVQKAILAEIYEWGSSVRDDVPNIFLLHGGSGVARTAIAHTVARHFDEQGRLGATVFFDSKHASCETIFPSIVREMAEYHPVIYDKVNSALNRNPKILHDPLEQQFHFLLSEVLENLTMIGPTLLVVDSLEKCTDRSAKHLLKLLGNFPPNIRILITAEPIDDILLAYSAQKCISCTFLDTHDEDLWTWRRYIARFFADLEETRPDMLKQVHHDPDDIQHHVLVKSSCYEKVIWAIIEFIAIMEDSISEKFIYLVFTLQHPKIELEATNNVRSIIESLLNIHSVADLCGITHRIEIKNESIQLLEKHGFIRLGEDSSILIENLSSVVGIDIAKFKDIELECSPPVHCGVPSIIRTSAAIRNTGHLMNLYHDYSSIATHCILTCKCSYPLQAMREENKYILGYLLTDHQDYCIRSTEESNTETLLGISEAIERHHTVLERYSQYYDADYGEYTYDYKVIFLSPPVQYSGLSSESADKITLLTIEMNFEYIKSSPDLQFEVAIYRAVTTKGEDILSQMQIKLDGKAGWNNNYEMYRVIMQTADVQAVKNPQNGKESWVLTLNEERGRYVSSVWFNCTNLSNNREDFTEDDANGGSGIGFLNSLLPGDRIAILSKCTADILMNYFTRVTLMTDPKERCPPTNYVK